jgi:carboxylesterase type B
MLSIAALAIWLSASLVNCHPAPLAGPTAHVKNGTYAGLHSAQYNQDYFLGIKYAQPPVGSLRFKTPASLNQSWSEAKSATAYSPEVRMRIHKQT